MIITERLYLVEAQEADIELIIEIENHKDNKDFIWTGTYDEHMLQIEQEDFLLLVIRQKSNDETVGFALIKLYDKSHVLELRNIVISKKGMGYGKEAIQALFKFAFEELNINRFWLDVYPDNHVGIKLYEGLGMHKDGMLRHSYKAERGYMNQFIYSILKSEYELLS